jgi:HSP20 family protein
MNAMLRWSPTRQLHFHRHDHELFNRLIGGPTDDTTQATERPAWAPAAEGRIEDGMYVIQLSLPGVDPKDVKVSLMENVLTVKGERTADHDTTGKDYFVRELAYGTFQRSFELPEGVDAAQVEAKHANGMLEVRVPSPKAATPRVIEVTAA